MKLRSHAFGNNERIPEKYTCEGENINPPLEIRDVPQATKSLALIMEDIDAPGGIWVHWIFWNLDPDTLKIEEGVSPKGVIEGMTDFGTRGYGGPCPPSGEHRYIFRAYALDDKFDIPKSALKKDLLDVIEQHILDSTELVGKYRRI